MLWGAIVLLMVLLAIYVSVGRMVMGNLHAYREAILQELNVRLPFSLEAEYVSGEWQSFSPVLVLSGLRLTFPGTEEAPLELSEGRFGLDVLGSLMTGSLQMTGLALSDLHLKGRVGADGSFRLTGFGSGGGELDDWAQALLLNIENVVLRKNRLALTMPSGEVRELDLELLLAREGSRRQLDATLTSTRGAVITLLAEGIGDPFQPEFFSGDMYLAVSSDDLGAMRDMLAGGSPPVWADGSIDLGVWVSWDRGEPEVEASVEATDLLITHRDAGWQLPLERVALQAHLREHRDHWTAFASGLRIENGGTQLELSRLQLDAWGGALRVRAADVPLAAVSAIAGSLEVIPAGLRDTIAGLAPQGMLTALQLSTGDIADAAADWEVEANFDDVSVASYRGAPGAASARGHAILGPGGGTVLIDSRSLSMEFPKIYDGPLLFDEIHGSLDLAWDAERVTLSSGLLSARGEEGKIRALFGLDIPLQPSSTGIEMDLLVGVQDSHPIYRAKYVPNVLDENLSAWLDASIGDGHIEEAAFLWRGSLRGDAAPQRTVQLAFNVTDTYLEYHPDWPPAIVETGIVLINDARVSVWSDSATLFDSTASRLSVESWLNADKKVTLAVSGAIRGPAADGLAVLNESPLTALVGGAFSDWGASGDLETEVDLELVLGQGAPPPVVDVHTRWLDVDLDVMPGKLPVKSVDGEFAYSSARGFELSGLAAELWGQVVSADLSQRHAVDAYDPATSVVELELAALADMDDVRGWLQLEPLAFSDGQASATVGIRLEPGRSPVLTVDSDLLGVSLDLPDPWRKASGEPMTMHLEMPLAKEGGPLSIRLGEDLELALDLEAGSLRGAALGVNTQPQKIEPGVFRVTGHAPLLQADQWIAFVREYFLAGDDVNDSDAAGQLAGAEPSSVPVQPLRIRLEQLSAETLVILERRASAVELNLTLDSARWDIGVQTDWLRGSLSLARDGSPSNVRVRYLDLDQLVEFASVPDRAAGVGADQAAELERLPDLPPMRVVLEELYQSERRLGSLEFDLDNTDAVLTAADMSGELAGLSMPAEHPARLVWQQGEPGRTELVGRFVFSDLGDSLDYFDYQRILQTEEGHVDLALDWPGSPREFTLLEGRGSVLVDIGSGSFLEVPAGAAGALRVVSILNLADIVRRLSLSHMFESGIPFDSVRGDVYLHDGTVEVTRMDIKGGSSFRFSGVSDVASRSLNGELVATLPVANNLPWIAALAASLPVAAGVFVVSKIFDKQMNRLSSAVYSIKGSWDEPDVRFNRIFDDTAAASKVTVADDARPPAGESTPGSASKVPGGEVTGKNPQPVSP